MGSRALVAGVIGLAVLAAPAAAQPREPQEVPSVVVADLPTIRAAIAAPGATAVLVNVWATWCDACREELPRIVRFYQAHRAAGLRLILISADDEAQAPIVAKVLADAGVGDARAFIKKHGDDTKFLNAFDRGWGGALPASFLYDGRGRKRRFWSGAVSAKTLARALDRLAPSK